MKISCKNFGPIRDFSIDLSSDFFLIVGENNIGKSYAISLLYAILKTITASDALERPYISEIFIERVLDKTSSALKDDFTRQYKSASVKDIVSTEIVRSSALAISKLLFTEPLEKTVEGTFGGIENLENRKNDDDTTVCISTESLEIHLKITNGHVTIVDIATPLSVIFRKSKQHRVPRRSNNDLIVYGASDDIDTAVSQIAFEGFRLFRDFAIEALEEISDVHYLPASRSGLYQALSAFGQIIAELSRRRTFLSQRIELPAISEPLVDYFLKLTEIKSARKSNSNSFLTVAEEMERSILGGSVEFDSKTKRLFYKPFDVDLRLDLSSTSSMVSEVAPIVTYLKHVLPESPPRRTSRRLFRELEGKRRKQIIFIEEPEAHLHPITQVRLMQSFARLVAGGEVKLVLTSHSNFIFNKISNLVISGEINRASTEAFMFKKSDLGTISHRLEVDDLGISDENFVDVSESLYSEKLDLFQNMKSEEN